jgi:SAM-dependent methyltransferase
LVRARAHAKEVLDLKQETKDDGSRNMFSVGPVSTIEHVKAFWNNAPLWTGDGQARGAVGTREFFDSHYAACLSQAGGKLDRRLLPVSDGAILDLGCGIGFWLQYFHSLGYTDLTGADLSERSLEIARQRCDLFGIPAKLCLQNAEATTFEDAQFDHIQSIGVIHHSPNPRSSLAEMWRILRPGGRAVVAVYYRNVVLRRWRMLRGLVRFAGALGVSLGGRGRDNMLRDAKDADDLVRLYDGRDNPIGLCFSRKEYRALVRSSAPWVIEHMFAHSFPQRAIPFRIPHIAYLALEWGCPMLICAVLAKPADHA